MTRYLLKLALIIACVLTVTNLVARMLGSTQPPNPALRGFTEGCEDKPQPCWYGIVPDVTTMKEALVELTNHGARLENRDLSNTMVATAYSDNCMIDIDAQQSNTINSVAVTCSDLRLGDVISYLGNPNSIAACYDNPLPFAFVVFDHGVVVQTTSTTVSHPWASPAAQIIVEISQPDKTMPELFSIMTYRWRGFAMLSFYEQIYPSMSNTICFY